MTQWPRLSESLPYRRAIGVCQACGAVYTDTGMWLEHDDADGPGNCCERPPTNSKISRGTDA